MVTVFCQHQRGGSAELAELSQLSRKLIGSRSYRDGSGCTHDPVPGKNQAQRACGSADMKRAGVLLRT